MKRCQGEDELLEKKEYKSTEVARSCNKALRKKRFGVKCAGPEGASCATIEISRLTLLCFFCYHQSIDPERDLAISRCVSFLVEGMAGVRSFICVETVHPRAVPCDPKHEEMRI